MAVCCWRSTISIPHDIRTATLDRVAVSLAEGSISSRDLVEAALDRAKDPRGEGQRVFVVLHEDRARMEADAADRFRAQRRPQSRYAGIPVSIKDLFDEAGHVSRAGSKVLSTAAKASRDAYAVDVLRRNGFVIIGRTNMTELAYSGLGLNPHNGTPANSFDRKTGRIPGGSSSGAAVSVTDGMAWCALGSDTGGSCRIPAALSGLTGFKPTQSRALLEGVVPLSQSLDTTGWMARSVACCHVLFDLMTSSKRSDYVSPAYPKLGIPQQIVFDGIDDEVMSAFDRALDVFRKAGFLLQTVSDDLFSEASQLGHKGGLVAAESFARYGKMLEQSREQFDPRVAARIERGRGQSAAEYLHLRAARSKYIKKFNAAMQQYDAIVFPTVPDIAPTFDSLKDDAEYDRINLKFLRNSTLINAADGCAVSIPIQAANAAPVGLTVAMRGGADQELLYLAERMQHLIGQAESG